jgi:hypothetical protein
MPASSEAALPDALLTAGLIGTHIRKTRLPRALEIMCADAGIELDFNLIGTASRSEFDFKGSMCGKIKKAGWSDDFIARHDPSRRQDLKAIALVLRRLRLEAGGPCLL